MDVCDVPAKKGIVLWKMDNDPVWKLSWNLFDVGLEAKKRRENLLVVGSSDRSQREYAWNLA